MNYIAKHDIYPGAVRILDEEEKPRRKFYWDRFIRDHIVTVIIAALMLTEGLAVGFGTAWSLKRNLKAQYEAEYEARLEAYKQEQAYEQQAKAFLSGNSSLEQEIQRAADAIAPVIARLETDQQKRTEIGCMIARYLSGLYPQSFVLIAEQESQWPLYDGKIRTYTQHDRDLAEEMVRPLLESDILPAGLTKDYIYASWSPGDLVLRNTWDYGPSTRTWRYQ